MKPPQPNATVNSREMEEAMRKVKEAHSLIAAAVEPGEWNTWHGTWLPTYTFTEFVFFTRI